MGKEKNNPFHLKGYHGPSLFCDREEETEKLISNAQNGVNTTLFSIRRMGKTGLIHHTFHKLENKKKQVCIYVDIYATQSIRDFTNELASAILKRFPQNRRGGKKFMDFIKGLSPIISFDPLTGAPEVSIQHMEPKQYEYSLRGLFEFLDQQNRQIVIAIDEFQQVAQYEEKNTEALLRTIIQTLKNINFIFSGSRNHLLAEMFNNSKRPFFASTQAIQLGPISKEKYASFIKSRFKSDNRSIDEDSIDFILNWTRSHTYYTQVLCNKIYAQGKSSVKIKDVYHACDTLLREQEYVFFQYRNLLTSKQWGLLKAIAREDKVYQPTGIQFISKYEIGNPATVKRALESLIDKEMVIKINEEDKHYYMLYHCFLSRWLAR